MIIPNHSDDEEQDFLNRARQGDYSDDYELMDAVNKAFEEEQFDKKQDKVEISLNQGKKRLKYLAAIIVKAASRAYPHLVKRDNLTEERNHLRQINENNRTTKQDGVTRFFLGISPLVLFLSVTSLLISPTRAVVSVSLVLSSIAHAIVICTGILVLATIRNQNQSEPKDTPNKSPKYRLLRQLFRNPITFIARDPIWNVIAVVLSVLITIFCIISSQERLSISLLMGAITLLSALAICFGGKGGLFGIQYLYFLIRDAWMSLRIISENLQLWLPSRLHRVETTLQEYINLANQYTGEDRSKLPIGPFSKATQAVLTEWYGYNPFPSPPPEPPTPLTPPLAPVPRNPNNSSSEAQLDEAEPLTNAPESVQNEEYFSSPLDRRIRDAESEI